MYFLNRKNHDRPTNFSLQMFSCIFLYFLLMLERFQLQKLHFNSNQYHVQNQHKKLSFYMLDLHVFLNFHFSSKDCSTTPHPVKNILRIKRQRMCFKISECLFLRKKKYQQKWNAFRIGTVRKGFYNSQNVYSCEKKSISTECIPYISNCE